LGPTFDYTHRLLDAAFDTTPATVAAVPVASEPPKVLDLLGAEGLIEKPKTTDEIPGDITQDPASFPMPRDQRLQSLARGDEGFLLSLAYSTQRGYGRTHPFAGEIRLGEVEIEFMPEELGFPIVIGELTLTECEMINQFKGSADVPPQFTRGYGLGFGQCERKVMAMALVDRSLRAGELGEERAAPAQDEEFVISHCDNVQATGFCRASQAAALRGFPGRAGSAAATPRRSGFIAGGRGMNAPAYNFAYLDEQTKRMIRRAILKAIAIPGYQVPFASREMPMPYWLGYRRRSGDGRDHRTRRYPQGHRSGSTTPPTRSRSENSSPRPPVLAPPPTRMKRQ